MNPRALTPASALLLATLALAACSSGDDDTSDASDQTSQFNPDLEQPGQPVSRTPGGDTSAVAGLWDASLTGVVSENEAGESITGTDTLYVQISDDGLWTRYDYDQDDVGSPERGNCYRIDGPFTLTPEDVANDDYSLAGEDDPLKLVADGDMLSVRFGDAEAQRWTRTQGEVTVEGFNECE